MRYSGSTSIIVTEQLPPPVGFVEVPNTAMTQLLPQIGQQFKERGSASGFSSSFSPWCTLARRSGKFYGARLGGHSDSVFNGKTVLDAVAAKSGSLTPWTLLKQPSDYSDPVWNESTALYVAAGLDPANPANNIIATHGYLPNQPLPSVWKDGQCVSLHSYRSFISCGTFGLYMMRDGIVHIDPVTGAEAILCPSPADDTNDVYAFWNPTTQLAFLGADSDSQYGRSWQVDFSTTPPTITQTNLKVVQWSYSDTTPFENQDKVYKVSTQQAGDGQWHSQIIDTTAGTVTELPISNADPFAGDALLGLSHCNADGIVALRASGMLAKVDSTTGAVTNWMASGIPGAVLGRLAVTNRMYERFGYEPAITAHYIIPDTDLNMRIFDRS